MYMYVYVYMYVCVYLCIYIYIHARVGVYIHSCRRTSVLSNLSTICACITGVSYHLHACVGGGLAVGFVSACSWLALVTAVGGYVLAGVEIGVLSCMFFYFCGC